MQSDLVPVEQVDRDAAADYLIAAYPEAARDARVRKLRNGEKDSDPAAQAFARHRIRHTAPDALSFQERVQPWMMECFGAEIASDVIERNDRFIEEALELVQANCYTADRAHALVEYVFRRPVGEPAQEVGGVMVTLAALCLAAGLDMHDAGETELARIKRPEIVEKIRAKQAAKPTGSALPIATPAPSDRQPYSDADDEIVRAFIDGWNARLDHADFDMALHFWMLASVTHIGATILSRDEVDNLS